MNFYQRLIEIFIDFKKQGVSKSDADSLLEFDSDEYPDFKLIKRALDEVYGSQDII